MAKKGLPIKKAEGKPVPVKIVSDVAGLSKDNEAQERKWRAEDDIRTMQRAEEIRRDKERMKAMKEIAKKQMNDLKKIC